MKFNFISIATILIAATCFGLGVYSFKRGGSDAHLILFFFGGMIVLFIGYILEKVSIMNSSFQKCVDDLDIKISRLHNELNERVKLTEEDIQHYVINSEAKEEIEEVIATEEAIETDINTKED